MRERLPEPASTHSRQGKGPLPDMSACQVLIQQLSPRNDQLTPKRGNGNVTANIDSPALFHYNEVMFHHISQKEGFFMKKVTAVLLACMLLAVSVPAFAGTEQDGAIVGDMLFARPLGLAAVVAGAAAWIVTLPFAALGGNIDQTTHSLITNPVKYTFARPVGEFYYEPTVIVREENR